MSRPNVLLICVEHWAGARLGAVEFGYHLPQTLVLLSLTWALLLPLLLRVVTHVDSQHSREPIP